MLSIGLATLTLMEPLGSISVKTLLLPIMKLLDIEINYHTSQAQEQSRPIGFGTYS